MSCPCRVPFELYPDASEWGPLLWTCLHGLAERSGKVVTPMYQEDERRAWLALYKATAEIIPCPACKEHFQEYLKLHPTDELKQIPYARLHDWVRDWFWEVHNWVNMTLKKPVFDKDSLTARYKGISLRKALRDLENPMKRAIMLSGNNNKKFADWKSKFILILSILGVE